MKGAISSAAIRLAKAEAAYVNDPKNTAHAECECGHEAHWHSHGGAGVCEHGEPCECEAFSDHDDDRDGPDDDRAYDEWRDR